jgi:RNA-directed DNA polymerase
MASFRNFVRFMMAKATMTERNFNLVVPLANKATDMRTADTAGNCLVRSGAVTPLIVCSDRQGDVDSTNKRSTLPTLTTPGVRISSTAASTMAARATKVVPALSAE